MTHELGIVQSHVENILQHLEKTGVTHVEEVHFRRGSAFSGEALVQSFEAMTRGTPLEGAHLVVDTVNLDHQCSCGRQQVITSDDLVGHMFVCPQCGTIREVEEAHDLELIEVKAAQPAHG